MTYKQREHVVSLLTKLIVGLFFILYVLFMTGFELATVSARELAGLVLGLFVAQIIAQTITTTTHAFFVSKHDRIADERDREILSRADQIGGYVLGLFMMVGIGMIALGKDTSALLYTLGVGGLTMGLVSDCIRIYGYRK